MMSRTIGVMGGWYGHYYCDLMEPSGDLDDVRLRFKSGDCHARISKSRSIAEDKNYFNEFC